MRKGKKLKKKENIVYFPGLPQRLLSMGIEQLEMKNYETAANFLLQAREMEGNSPDIETALLVALSEMGNFEDTRILCEDMLKKGIGDYFETIDIYLMVLIQLKEYKKVAETIKILIEEKEIPLEKLNHYEKLLQFSEKRFGVDTINYPTSHETKEILTSTNIHEQILAIAGLMNINIQPYIKELTRFLGNREQHPFVQTMVLNILKEHGFEKKIAIEKFHYKSAINPTELQPLFETPFYIELRNQLQKNIEQKNPSLYEQIKIIMDKHFFLLYPFELEPSNVMLWMAAYHSMGQELYGEQVSQENMCENYQIKESELRKCLEFLRILEEISLPNL